MTVLQTKQVEIVNRVTVLEEENMKLRSLTTRFEEENAELRYRLEEIGSIEER